MVNISTYYLVQPRSPPFFSSQSNMDKPRSKTYSAKDEEYSSFSSTAGYGGVGWTQEEEKALVRKFDWRILPGLSVLYLLNFLDRA